MAEEFESTDSLFEQPLTIERNYDWLGASSRYESAFSKVPESHSLTKGKLSERIAYASYRHAMQAETNDKFKKRIEQAYSRYSKTREDLRGVSDKRAVAFTHRCDAMVSMIEYWKAQALEEKKGHIAKSWESTRKAMMAFEEDADIRNLVDTSESLNLSMTLAYSYSSDLKERRGIIQQDMERCEKAISQLSPQTDAYRLSRSLIDLSSTLEGCAAVLSGISEYPKNHKRAVELYSKAKKVLAEKSTDLIYGRSAIGEIPLVYTSDEFTALLKEQLEESRKTNDRYLIGSALEALAHQSLWRTGRFETYDKRKEILDEGLKYAIDARREYSVISFLTPFWNGIMWVEEPHVAYYGAQALHDPNVKQRANYALKAIDASDRMSRLAESSGFPEVISLAYYCSGMARIEAAKAEKDGRMKKELLERGIELVEEADRIEISILPHHLWDQGITKTMKANAEHVLASLEARPEDKRRVLQTTIEEMESGIQLMEEHVGEAMEEEKTAYFMLGIHHFDLGEWYEELQSIEEKGAFLEKAAAAFDRSAEFYGIADQTSRKAESQWKSAQVRDSMGDHSKSSELFTLASEGYAKAVERLPQLSEIYSDHSLYMNAWSEIERARHYHTRQEYGESKKHYENASRLHESTNRWKHLAPNYLAWAEIENGEDLSRRERSKEAIEAFGKAADLFDRTKDSLKTHKNKLEDQAELENLEKLARAADLRREYCVGRVALEEAKLLDRQGDEFASCEKFGCAEAAFKKIQTGLESDEDKREIQLIMILSKAWQMMAKAEAEASPELYDGASRLFEEAKELSVGEKAKLLALGHSRFCKALEAGTKFGDTGDTALHAVASQNLESAAKSYLKAGLERDAEYAKGSKLLFDAYVYMDKANKEEDTTKKAKLYAMTEKVLEASANSFAKSNYVKKKEQVTKLLQKVKEDRELAVSLMEVFHAPDVISSTMSFAAPSQTHETAVGVEKFQHASIQATLRAKPKDLKVGDELNLEIALVNAGRAPAQLVKIEDMIPNGFEVLNKPELCKIEDSFLNMKGRRLDSLKTDEIAIILKPSVQGHFSLKPRVMYLDEDGNYKSHEPEPVEIDVRELGISGWLKGPEKKR